MSRQHLPRRAPGAQPAGRRLRHAAPWQAFALLASLLLGGASGAAAQAPAQQGRPQPQLSVHVMTFRHQAATDALALVTPLLSPRGTVELRAGTNTLVVRDSMASLARILPVLYSFDHPARLVRVEMWLIRAGGPPVPVSPQMSAAGIPPELLRNLREHLPYQTYTLLAGAEARGREGERVFFDLGQGYLIRFRLGTEVSQRLRLHEFEVLLEQEAEPPASLVRSQLNLWLDRNMVLALSAGEASSTALMVVVRCSLAAAEEDP